MPKKEDAKLKSLLKNLARKNLENQAKRNLENHLRRNQKNQARRNLENQGINPLIKDESESARLAGFGISNIGIQQLFVHESEVPNATKIINVTLGQMKL